MLSAVVLSSFLSVVILGQPCQSRRPCRCLSPADFCLFHDVGFCPVLVEKLGESLVFSPPVLTAPLGAVYDDAEPGGKVELLQLVELPKRVSNAQQPELPGGQLLNGGYVRQSKLPYATKDALLQLLVGQSACLAFSMSSKICRSLTVFSFVAFCFFNSSSTSAIRASTSSWSST